MAGQTAQAARRWLGPGGAGLTAMLLRRALTRAVAGGASGAVIGALQAGLRAAMEGRDLAGTTAAMQQGWKGGLVAGAVLGGVGGAMEARSAHRLKTSLEATLREVRLESSRAFRPLPASYEADDVLRVWVDSMKANPNAGNNKRILELLPRVWQALHDPDTIARTVAEVSMEANLRGVLDPRDAVTRNTQAVMSLSRRTGAKVTVLGPEESYFPQEFFEKVVVRGNRFLDRSILKDVPEHGAATHLIQDLAVDRLLRRIGVRAEEFRQLLREAVGPGGLKVGKELWDALFDSFEQDINRPEVLYPILQQALGGLE